jgi:glutamyl-tRNA reductase
MSLLALGVTHETAPTELLERLAVPGDEHPKALASLTALEHVVEAAVLSTCNRVEVYAHASRFHPALEELIGWFADRGGIDPETAAVTVQSRFDDAAAAHLFAVASGLDSLIVGERQIAVQVKQAAKVARAEGASRRVVQTLFNRAIHCSRRVRSETDIDRGAASMVELGLRVATERADTSLAGRTALIVGAGKIGGLTAGCLDDLGVARTLIRNRSRDRAERLADRVGAVVVDDLGPALAEADLVVCCAGASRPLIGLADLRAALADRAAPLLVLDLALPRNVDPAAGDLDGVELIDLDDVRAVADEGETGASMAAALSIVEEETDRFRAWTHAVRVEPTIRALRERAEEVRADELERLASRLSHLDDGQRETVEALTRGIVNTLLHEPTVRLKGLADRGGAEHYAIALRELFDLDE